MIDLLIEMSTKEKGPKAKQCVHLLRLTNTEPLSVCNNKRQPMYQFAHRRMYVCTFEAVVSILVVLLLLEAIGLEQRVGRMLETWDRVCRW